MGEEEERPMMLMGQLLSKARFRSLEFGAVGHEGEWRTHLPSSGRAVLYALLQGELWFQIDGIGVVHLDAGDVLLMPRGPSYTIFTARDGEEISAMDLLRRRPIFTYTVGSAQPADCRFFAALGSWDDASRDTMARILPDFVHIRRDQFANRDDVDMILQLIEREIERARDVSPMLVMNLVNLLLNHILMAKCSSPRVREQMIRAAGSPAVAKSLMIIHASMVPDFTVTELARRVMTSRSALTSEFHETLGMSPGRYLLRVKMERAADLLNSTDYHVNTVADMVGYESTPSFIKAFKRWYQVSPNRYRNEHRATPPEDQLDPWRYDVVSDAGRLQPMRLQ